MLIASLVAAAVVALVLLARRHALGPSPERVDALVLAELQAAWARSPGDVPLAAKLAQQCLRCNDLEGAQKHFRGLLLQPLEKSPLSKAEIFYFLAEVSGKKGERAPALRLLQRALEADPALEPAQRLQADLSPRPREP